MSITTTTLTAGTADPGDHPHGPGSATPLTGHNPTTMPGAVVGPVLTGELLSAEESAAVARRFARPGRVRLGRRAAGLAGRAARSETGRHVVSVARYRARQAPLDLTRLVWFVVRGHARWVGKGWTWATHGDLRADARAARVAGDVEARRAAQEMIRADATARWARLGIALHRIAAVAAVLAVLGLVLLLTDMVMPRETMPGWLLGVYAVLGFLWAALPWLLKAALVGWLIAAAWEGRDRTPGAKWLTRPDRADTDSWVDERMITTALAHLGIPALTTFLKTGAPLVYTVPARVDGDGTGAQIRLPLGVTADMVAAARPKLAANLGRATLETWPTEGDEAGILDLWVADKGKLGSGAGPWPLLADGQVDIFDGVPVGRSQRGDVVSAPVFEANWLIGGRPGQGKSAAMRTLLLGAALDPTAELWVYVMGESPDFEPFRPRLARYAMGMDDHVADDALTALRDLLAEMERRGKVLGTQPGRPPKTSRRLADKPGLGLHVIVCAIDECHELFMHPKYGKEAADLAVRLIKRGRKYGICLVLATQSPTKDSIPREVTRNVSAGVAFAVADHVANDGLLGAGKYKAGIRATDLRMKTDRGTSVAVGITDNVFELLRWFYIPYEDGHDAVTPVITRAVALMAEHGARTTGRATDPAGEDVPVVDHLADIATVLGGEPRLRTLVVLSRLAELRPDTYEGWTFADLQDALPDGAKPYKTQGVMQINADRIHHAITERDQAGDDTEGED